MNLHKKTKTYGLQENPKLRIGYTGSTYDKLCARIEEQFPENFVEMTEQQMLDLDDEAFCKWRKHERRLRNCGNP